MAKTDVKLPAMGEGIIEATIVRWLVKEGEFVNEDQPIVEIATDKVDSEIGSPAEGVIKDIFFKEGDVPSVGDLLATIVSSTEADDENRELAATPESTPQNIKSAAKTPVENSYSKAGSEAYPGNPDKKMDQPSEETNIEHATSESPENHHFISSHTSSGKFITPLVRNMAKKEGITADQINKLSGTGEGGRITKDDITLFIEKLGKQKSGKATSISISVNNEMPQVTDSGDKIFEMDRVRKLIAAHMVRSKQTSPHATTFIDADVTPVVKWREKVKDGFLKRENQKITFMPVFVEAVAKSLKEFPMVNISVADDKIVIKKSINIGMAVALPDGNLIVPVIKSADEKSLTGLTKSVNELAEKARNSKLTNDDISGGTFTITNLGSFGNTMGTPIINQPQAAILGTGAIIKKPVVLETEEGDVIAIRHIMTLSLSFDHRVIDGALGGMFIKRVAEHLEQFKPDRQI